MTTDVVVFLTAVHDADEQTARAAMTASKVGLNAYWQTGRWEVDDDEPDVYGVDMGGGPGVVATRQEAAHIARHDPQSVLARVEAERALVALHRRNSGGDVRVTPAMCDSCPEVWPCPTLRALAWGYRGREGWQAEWAPDGVEVGT